MLFQRHPMHRPRESGLIFPCPSERRGAAATPNPHSQILWLRTGNGAGGVWSGSFRAWAATYRPWGYLWIKIVELTLQVLNSSINQYFHDTLYDIPRSTLSPNKPEYPSRFSAGRKELWKKTHPINSQLQSNIFSYWHLLSLRKTSAAREANFSFWNGQSQGDVPISELHTDLLSMALNCLSSPQSHLSV